MIIQAHRVALAIGMLISGGLQMAWFAAGPSPDRIGFWFIQLFWVLPALGLLGIFGLFHHKQRNLSITTLGYIGAILLLMTTMPFVPSTSLLWAISVERLCMLFWIIAVIGMVSLSLGQRWIRGSIKPA